MGGVGWDGVGGGWRAGSGTLWRVREARQRSASQQKPGAPGKRQPAPIPPRAPGRVFLWATFFFFFLAGENLASPGIIQKHLNLTFRKVSGLNFFSRKQSVPLPLSSRCHAAAARGGRRTPAQPPEPTWAQPAQLRGGDPAATEGTGEPTPSRRRRRPRHCP